MGPQDDTVEALVETVRNFLAVEDDAEQSVNSRAGGVVVFGGVILSIVASLGRTVLSEDLPGWWDAGSVAAFVVAVFSLLAAVVMTLFNVLLPRQSAAIAMSEIDRYGELDYVSQPRVQVQGTLLEGLIRLLAIDRERVSNKTRWLRIAYVSLVLGLFAVAALGLILGARESGMI